LKTKIQKQNMTQSSSPKKSSNKSSLFRSLFCCISAKKDDDRKNNLLPKSSVSPPDSKKEQEVTELNDKSLNSNEQSNRNDVVDGVAVSAQNGPSSLINTQKVSPSKEKEVKSEDREQLLNGDRDGEESDKEKEQNTQNTENTNAPLNNSSTSPTLAAQTTVETTITSNSNSKSHSNSTSNENNANGVIAANANEKPQEKQADFMTRATDLPQLSEEEQQRICEEQERANAQKLAEKPDPNYPYDDVYRQWGMLGEPTPENKHKKCIVIDLDETLVHSSFEKNNREPDYTALVGIEGTPHEVSVLVRPYVTDFWRR